MTTDPDSHKENGDAIEGDRIACQFRKMDKITLYKATSNHRIQNHIHGTNRCGAR